MALTSNRILALSFAAALAAFTVAVIADNGFADDRNALSDREFGERVRQFLMNNPEVIVEVYKVYQDKVNLEQAQLQNQAVIANREQLINDPHAPVAGNPNAPVTLVEFFDYRCGYCKKILGTMMNYVGHDSNVRVVFKEFPILDGESPGPSEFASRAALASLNQDESKYLAYHNALMTARGGLTLQSILAMGEKVGLDPERLKADMNSPAITEMIRRNRELAQKLRISGTPTLVIGNEVLRGAQPRERIQQAIVDAMSAS